MSIGARILNWFRGDTRSVPEHFDFTKTPVIRLADGFMPMQIFTGGTLKHNLEASIWSYACITQNAEAIASLPVIVQEEHDGEWAKAGEAAVPHRLRTLTKRPLGHSTSGAPQWSWGAIIEAITQHCYLSGNAFLLPIDMDNSLALRLILSPGEMRADEDHRGYPSMYYYKTASYRPDQIVNIQSCHPGSYWKGHSALDVVSDEISTDKTASERIRHNLRNRIGAGMAVMIEGYWGTNDEEREAVLKHLRDNYQKSSQDGTPLVLGNVSHLQATPDQGHGLEIFDTRNFSRRAIMSAFHTPPPMIGDYEKATLNNMKEAEKIWWKAALDPMARQIYEAINSQLIWPRFGDRIRLWYDISHQDIGISLLEDRAKVAKLFVDVGVPANFALNLVGITLPTHIPELDKPLMILDKAGRVNNDG